MSTKDNLKDDSTAKDDLLRQLDDIIENGFATFETAESMDSSDFDEVVEGNADCNPKMEALEVHDYDVVSTSPYVLSYVAGYTVRKCNRFTTCLDCMFSLQTRVRTERHKFINFLNEGSLIYPSEELEQLLDQLEDKVLSTVGKLGLNINTLYQIMQEIGTIEMLKFVGCPVHQREMTKNIVIHFVIMRGHFLSKLFNRINDQRKEKTKNLRKAAKY